MLCAVISIDENFGIGKDGKLLFPIKKDLKRFKQITEYSTIIMGRKTFESLPNLLSNRHHIVLTRNKNFKIDGVEIINDIQQIKKYIDIKEEVYIIGGGILLKDCIQYCEKLYITKIFNKFEDATSFMPKFDENNYEIIYKSEIMNENNQQFQFIDYKFIKLDNIGEK